MMGRCTIKCFDLGVITESKRQHPQDSTLGALEEVPRGKVQNEEAPIPEMLNPKPSSLILNSIPCTTLGVQGSQTSGFATAVQCRVWD